MVRVGRKSNSEKKFYGNSKIFHLYKRGLEKREVIMTNNRKLTVSQFIVRLVIDVDQLLNDDLVQL